MGIKTVEEIKSYWNLLHDKAVSVLAIIGSKEVIGHIKTMKNDPSTQAGELVEDIHLKQ